MKKRSFIRIITLVVLLVLLYLQGISLTVLVFIGFFALLFMLLRGHLYKNIEHYLKRLFPRTKKWKQWVRKAVIFILFLAVLIITKQTIFFLLELVGFDIRQIIIDSIQVK